jgi:hypothetical protein
MNIIKIIPANKIKSVLPAAVTGGLNGNQHMDISFIAVADKVNKGDFRTDISQITLVAINKNPWRFDLGLADLPHLGQARPAQDKDQYGYSQPAAKNLADICPDFHRSSFRFALPGSGL